MVGWTYNEMVEETQKDKGRVLPARARPLLGIAASHPSIQQMLNDLKFSMSQSQINERLGQELPTLMCQAAFENPLLKLFG